MVWRVLWACAAALVLVVAAAGCGPVGRSAQHRASSSSSSAVAAAAKASSPPGRSGASRVSRGAVRGVRSGSPPSGKGLTLAWESPPAPWTTSTEHACAWESSVRLTNGVLAVPLVNKAAVTSDGLWHCGVGVVAGARWHVAALPPGDIPAVERVVGGGGLVVGLRRGPNASVATTTSAAPLMVYRAGGWTRVALPKGQVVQSVVALSGGGYGVGTASPAVSGRCTGASCILGRIGLHTAGQWRWVVPPLPAQLATSTVYGGYGSRDIPGGVQLGAVQGDNLWFAVNGIGVAALDLPSGWFDFQGGGQDVHYYSGAYGPAQFLGVLGATVYFGVHRLPGIADAGYWGSLLWVSDGSGSVRTALPVARGAGAANFGCLQGGVGAPRAVHVVAGRMWVRWSGCQVYEATVGAARLQRPDFPWCSNPRRIGVAYVGTMVSEVCATKAGTTELEFSGGTATVLHRYVWTRSALFSGYGPIHWYPAGDGAFWAWTAVGKRPGPRLLEVSPEGKVLRQGPLLHGMVTGVAGHAHVWLATARGVARLPA